MKPLVYIESSVVSYLTARPKNLISQGRVAVTAAWWEQSAQDYERVLDVDREAVEALGDELLLRHALPAI